MTGHTAPSFSLADSLMSSVESNFFVLGLQWNELTHKDSLLQPRPRGNCLNWVIGHIALHRVSMLQTLGQDTGSDEQRLARYRPNTDPVTGDGDGVLFLPELIAIVSRQQRDLLQAIADAKPDGLNQPAAGLDGKSVGQQLNKVLFHETYHVGQTELLRQLAGTDDKVI